MEGVFSIWIFRLGNEDGLRCKTATFTSKQRGVYIMVWILNITKKERTCYASYNYALSSELVILKT